jgi:hypothetical protein
MKSLIHLILFEDFFEKEETLLQSLNRKARKYESIFDSSKIMFEEEGDEYKNITLNFFNEAFNFLDEEVSTDDEKRKLNEFLSERFKIGTDDWSSIFIKSCLLEFIDKEHYSDEARDIVSEITSIPNNFNLQNFKVQEVEEIKPGNIVAWKVDSEEKPFIHYSILLFKEDDELIILDSSIKENESFNGTTVKIVSTTTEREKCVFLGYFDIISNIKEKEKEESEKDEVETFE